MGKKKGSQTIYEFRGRRGHFYGFVILTGLTFFWGGWGGGGQKLLSENVKQNYFVFYIAVFLTISSTFQSTHKIHDILNCCT